MMKILVLVSVFWGCMHAQDQQLAKSEKLIITSYTAFELTTKKLECKISAKDFTWRFVPAGRNDFSTIEECQNQSSCSIFLRFEDSAGYYFCVSASDRKLRCQFDILILKNLPLCSQNQNCEVEFRGNWNAKFEIDELKCTVSFDDYIRDLNSNTIVSPQKVSYSCHFDVKKYLEEATTERTVAPLPPPRSFSTTKSIKTTITTEPYTEAFSSTSSAVKNGEIDLYLLIILMALRNKYLFLFSLFYLAHSLDDPEFVFSRVVTENTIVSFICDPPPQYVNGVYIWYRFTNGQMFSFSQTCDTKKNCTVKIDRNNAGSYICTYMSDYGIFNYAWSVSVYFPYFCTSNCVDGAGDIQPYLLKYVTWNYCVAIFNQTLFYNQLLFTNFPNIKVVDDGDDNRFYCFYKSPDIVIPASKYEVTTVESTTIPVTSEMTSTKTTSAAIRRTSFWDRLKMFFKSMNFIANKF